MQKGVARAVLGFLFVSIVFLSVQRVLNDNDFSGVNIMEHEIHLQTHG